MAAAALICLCLAADPGGGAVDVPGGAQALDAQALMDQALNTEAADPQGAIRLLAQIPAGDPHAPRADYERARVTDSLLHDLPAADLLYRRHLRDFPKSPYFRVAESRAAYLEANMGEAPAALAEFEAVTDGWSRKPAAQSGDDLVARMEKVVSAYPASPIRSRALFWLSNARLAKQDVPGAIHWLQVLADSSPSPKELHRAELQIALIEQRRGNYARALELDSKYLDSDDPLARELARNQRNSARSARLYAWLYASGLGLIGLLAASLMFGVWRRRAPLRPVPWELTLYLPIAVLFVLLTFLKEPKVGWAVLGIVGGGAFLATLNGAYLRVAHPRGLWRLSYLAAMGGAAASLAFCAVHAAHLTDLVVTTLAQGADR